MKQSLAAKAVFITILALLVFSSYASSDTERVSVKSPIEETKKWIAEKIKLYGNVFDEDVNNTSGKWKINDVRIDEKNLIIDYEANYKKFTEVQEWCHCKWTKYYDIAGTVFIPWDEFRDSNSFIMSEPWDSRFSLTFLSNYRFFAKYKNNRFKEENEYYTNDSLVADRQMGKWKKRSKTGHLYSFDLFISTVVEKDLRNEFAQAMNELITYNKKQEPGTVSKSRL